MKVIRILVVSVCLLFVSVVCHAEEDFEPTSVETYRAQGVTIGVPTAWEPYFFEDATGGRSGYCMELWRLWADTNGIEVRFMTMDQPESIEAVKAGEIDILGGALHSDELDEFLDFSDALHSSRVVLAIRDDGPVDCSNALSAGSVAVVKGSPAQEFFGNIYTGTPLVEFASVPDALEGFFAGKADAIAAAYPQLAKQGRESGVMDRLDICRTLFFREVYAGVKKGQTELLELVNDGMNEIPVEELQAVESRWFIPSEDPEIHWLPSVIPAAVAAFMIAVVVVFWVSRRRRK